MTGGFRRRSISNAARWARPARDRRPAARGPAATLTRHSDRRQHLGVGLGAREQIADLYAAGVPVPADREPPANGSPRFKSIVRRQVQSLAFLTVPIRFWLRMAFGGSFGGDRARATLDHEWPRARAAIDAGRLVPIGLIRVSARDPRNLTRNHQVIAWGYAEDGRGVTLRIYDPNWPDRDDVAVTIQLDNALRPTGLSQTTGEPLLGWFILPYSAKEPRAFRSAT